MTAQEFYSNANSSIPASSAYVPTLSDSEELTIVSRAIYVGTGGDLKVTLVGTGTVTFKNLPSGATMGVKAKQIWDTGTTASNLVVLY